MSKKLLLIFQLIFILFFFFFWLGQLDRSEQASQKILQIYRRPNISMQLSIYASCGYINTWICLMLEKWYEHTNLEKWYLQWYKDMEDWVQWWDWLHIHQWTSRRLLKREGGVVPDVHTSVPMVVHTCEPNHSQMVCIPNMHVCVDGTVNLRLYEMWSKSKVNFQI